MDRTWVSSIADRCFTVWAMSKPQWMAYFHLAAESIPKWCTGWTWTSCCVLVAQCIHCCMVVFALSGWLLSTAGAPRKKGPPDNNTHFCMAEKTQIECSLSMFGRDVWYSLIMYADCFRTERSGWMFTLSGRWMLPVISSTGTLKLSGLLLLYQFERFSSLKLGFLIFFISWITQNMIMFVVEHCNVSGWKISCCGSSSWGVLLPQTSLGHPHWAKHISISEQLTAE